MQFDIGTLGSNAAEFLQFQKSASVRDLKKTLSNFGRLDDTDHRRALTELTLHDNSDIRMLAIKNLAKYADEELKEVIMNIVRTDSSSLVRREAVSAIGRMRSESCVEDLVTLLHDRDPSVVMQAIRGLLVFKKIDSVREELIQIQNHPNEIIKEVIEIELLSGRKPSSKSHSAVDVRLKNIVVNTDVLQALEVIDPESIHLTFTSPPYYNAKDYSIYSSYQEYLDFLRSVFIETHRVTKEGRFLVVNTSPVIASRFSRSHASKRYPIPFDLHTILVSMGWEFIDDIVWQKPEYSVKARNNGFLRHRKPLAYKPNQVTEMVIVYRKKTSKLIDWNLKQYSKEILEESRVLDGYETSNLWKINPSNDSVHTAVFPNELSDKIIQYYSLVGDLVFDPFGGAGTLGLSAVRNKRNFFLTEIDEDYVNRMRVRFSKLEPPISSAQIIEPVFLSLDEFKESFEN
jgi:DNA modification methylase